MDDRELVNRFLDGERECFALLVRRHATPLWATLRRTLGDVEDARDVFQETWLRAFEGLGSLRDASRLRSWLVTIALNLVRQERRRRAAGPFESLAVEGGTEPAAADDVEAGVVLSEDVARLRARIAALPPRQREVVDLRASHGASHAEIGRLLGISEDSSRASYYQALRKLKAGFERDRRA